MSLFEIRQCSNPECGLRMPIDPEIHRGAFCPLCGARMSLVGTPFHHQALQQERRSIRLSVLLDNIRSAYNVGAIFRTADGAGVAHLYLGGITPNPGAHPAISKTALGAQEHIPWSCYPNACTLAEELRDQGYRLLALESTPDALPLSQYNLDPESDQPFLLILGNERAGVDPGLIDLCDAVLALPMLGEKASLNVAVAFGIAAYWLAFH